LVEALRSLKAWAGDPSCETLKDRVNTDLMLAVVAALHPDVG